MCPDCSPERLEERMNDAQRLQDHEWLEADPLMTALLWVLALGWCALCWGGLAWWFDLLPNWSWL